MAGGSSADPSGAPCSAAVPSAGAAVFVSGAARTCAIRSALALALLMVIKILLSPMTPMAIMLK